MFRFKGHILGFTLIIQVVLGTLMIRSNVYASFSEYSFQPMNQPFRTKEDFFRLYTFPLYQNIDNISRNIFYLELAYTLQWDDTPLLTITNEIQYEKYQFLVMTHICVLLTQEYINYGYLFMKENIYFFTTDFFEDYMDGYEVAETYFTFAQGWWDEAIMYAQYADSYTGVEMDTRYWGYNFEFEDEVYQMKTGELDYYPIIEDLMDRIKENRTTISNYLNLQ